jgi:hypothetical protein
MSDAGEGKHRFAVAHKGKRSELLQAGGAGWAEFAQNNEFSSEFSSTTTLRLPFCRGKADEIEVAAKMCQRI